MKQVYLDYAATTPVDPEVAQVMLNCLTVDGTFGNPSSNTHYFGAQANLLVGQARNHIAEMLHADPREIVFTSGATESDNLALKGVADAYATKGKHIITSMVEHKAVLDTCKYLETLGFEVTYLKPDHNGLHSLDQIKQAMTDETILVSIMMVNNEIGSIQPIAEIGCLCRERKILFHVDAAQAAGKLPIDVMDDKIDLLSISGHKLYGPKGIGILYVRRKPKIKLTPLIHGGGHEQGYRSGTLPTHQIVGLGKACEIAVKTMNATLKRISELNKKLLSGLSVLQSIQVNGKIENNYPGIINISFEGVDGEALIMALNKLALSSGSACNSAVYQPSHVLSAIGLSSEMADQSLRISIGRFTMESDIDFAISEITYHVRRLRKLSPGYKKYKI